MARLSDADQGGLPVPRLDSRCADRPGPHPLPRPRATHAGAAPPGDSGMAELLLQVTDDSAGLVSGTRSVHPAHQAEEHAAVPEGRRVDYTSGAGVLRLIIFAGYLTRGISPKVRRFPGAAELADFGDGSPSVSPTASAPSREPAAPAA